MSHFLSRFIPAVPLVTIVCAVVLFRIAYLVFFLTPEPSGLKTSSLAIAIDTSRTAKDQGLAEIHDATAKFAWAVSAAVQTAVFSLVILYFWIILYRVLTGYILWFCATVALPLVIGAREFAAGMRTDASSLLGPLPTDLLRVAVHGSGNRVLPATTNFENALAVVLGMSAALAVVAVLGETHSKRMEVERQIETIRRLLTATTIALTAGVIQIFFEYRWVAAVLFPAQADEKTKTLTEFGSTTAALITFGAASGLSLFLVACFVPAAAIIKSRSDQVNKSLDKDEKIDFDTGQLWKDALQIVAPLITVGPLAILFKA